MTVDSQGDDIMSLTANTEDTAVLTVEDDFESIYDVPFVTVNRVNGKILAEVILSDDRETDLERIQTALDIGILHRVHAYARVHGEYGNILIHFTDDTE